MATFSIENFKEESLKRDLARPNLFEVFLTPPSELTGKEERLVSLFCDSASLPPQRISTKRLNIYGESYPRPVGVEYGSIISLTFLLDSDMTIKKFFDSWLDIVVNRNSNNVSYSSRYIGGLKVSQLKSLKHDISYVIDFNEIFPTSVQMLDLDNNNFNSVHRMNVTFEYRKWKEIGPSKKNTGLNEMSISGLRALINNAASSLGQANLPPLLSDSGRVPVSIVNSPDQPIIDENASEVTIIDGNVIGGTVIDGEVVEVRGLEENISEDGRVRNVEAIDASDAENSENIKRIDVIGV